jgi:hypothetical protein
MATNKKFNVRHGLSAGTDNLLKDVIDDQGLVLDVGLLEDLKTIEKSNTVGAINELYDSIEDLKLNETLEPMGVVDRTKSKISFDNATKIFTIEPAPGEAEFIVWTQGIRRIYTSAQTVSIGTSPVTGMYYIYFDKDGVLLSKTSFYDLQYDTPISYVYWNSTTLKAEFVADERHGIVLDWATHEYLHKTRGAVIFRGFGLDNFTTIGDGSSDSHAQIDITDGQFFDEDLKINITHSLSPVVGTFTQVLLNGAEIPVFYQSGDSGFWVKDLATKFPVKFAAGERIRYNTLSGGQWITQQVNNNKYTISWIIATNDIYNPIICILDQNEYSNIAGAEEVSFGDLALPGFPILEFRPLWKVIYQTSSSFTNAPKARIAQVLDVRQIGSGTAGQIASHHGLLTGLSEDDHPQYVHTEIDRTISANHTFTGTPELSAGLRDRLGELGKVGQYLASTGTGVEWRFSSTKNVIYVSKDGNDLNTGSSLENAKATIKSALTLATTGTTIKVSAGEYQENNPLIVPPQVSIVGDSLREVTVIPQNNGDLFYVSNGNYVADMSFMGAPNTGAIFSFNPLDPPYISQSPYIQNCTNFVPNSQGLRIDGDHCIGPFKSMVVDSYTQYNQGGIGADIKNEAYAQLVSMFTICCDTAISCKNGGGCDLTNSNSSFGNFGLIADGVSPLKYRGIITQQVPPESNIITVDTTYSAINVSNATYNKTSGELLITTTSPHVLQIGADIEVKNLLFSCDSDSESNNYVSDRNADAANLISDNKEFIAKEAYLRMLQAYPLYTPQTGNTEQDCLDDVYAVTDAVLYNLKYGGNSRTYDAAEVYITNIFNGQSVETLIDAERDEASKIFQEVRDIAIQVMRNESVTISPGNTFTQTFDLTITEDPSSPSCQDVASALATLFGIVIQAIGTDSGPGNLTGITRTSPTQLFPSGAYGYVFTIKQIPGPSQILINVGSSDIDHSYISGGTVEVEVIRPFDGQAIHFNNLYYQVLNVKIISGGSGYVSAPTISFSDPAVSWGIPAQAISEVVDGELRSIELISAGRGYTSTPPTITISPPTGVGGVPATVQVEMVPEYYLVSNSEEVSPNIYRIELKSTVPFTIPVSENVYFYKQSRLLASGHSFEYIGSGTNIDTALPRKGGVPIQENETVSKNGGIVVYTSTDHSGNFRIGDGVIIDQTLGRISGDFYSRSLFSTMTPFILALGA